MKPLFYNKRSKLVKLFEKCCKENNADENDKVNLVTWLHMNGLLDVDKVEEYLKDRSEVNMEIYFGSSKPIHITEKDAGIWRRIIPNEECWKTGNYTDRCNCEYCSHKDECSGYDKEEE